MTQAHTYEILGKSEIQAKYARNASISDCFDEFGNLTHHIYADGSILDAVNFVEVQSVD